MRPYRVSAGYLVVRCFTVLSCVLALLLGSLAAEDGSARFVYPKTNAVAKRAFDHFYNMEYDKAVSDFESLVKDHPDDPFANNYLLSTVIFRELYRIGAMNSESYASDNFIDAKPKRPLDPAVQQQIRNLIARSELLTNNLLAKNPNDADALYARGVARGMRSTYMGLGEKSWVAAVRSALAARRDHERVLELAPNYTDAKMVVGVHNYIIGSLNWAARTAVALIGVGGSRDKGLGYLREVAHSDTLASMDAKIALALFLRREQKYPEALGLVRGMATQYPRNFLMAVEYANLLNAAGHGRDAISQYDLILKSYKENRYPLPEPEHAAWGLGVSLRGQREFTRAAEVFDYTATIPHADKEVTDRATLAAGEMYDMLQKRDLALRRYDQVLTATNREGPLADAAKKYTKKPFQEK